MQIPRFSFREMLLLTALVALLIPYLYTVGQKTFLPQYDFKVTEDDLVDWIQTIDPSARYRVGFSSSGGDTDESTEFWIEHEPDGSIMDAIRDGIVAKLKNDGWSLDSQTWGTRDLRFHFHKGPSRWRLFVYKIESKTDLTPQSKVVNIYLIIRVHDSKPEP